DRGERIGLAREFRYAVEHRIDRVPPDVFADCPRTPRELEPQNQVAALHNGMIAPLIPYGITGALFYQGESNEDTATTYRDRFTAMIRDVRTRWGQGQFPFYFVQLANFRANSRWAVLREAQHAALGEPNTAMVTAIDLGEPLDIHPRDKRSVGERLAGVALRRHYGFLDCAADGPRLSRVDFEGSRARVHFEHADGLHSADGEPVRGFELAGADRRFFPARGSIDDVNVIVASDEVRVPVALRYAFTDDPEVNLVNGSGLPALPFRTDGW
ncbi:MAG TPA: sialate O-acetylesterase, partial [Polyangiaceae bacterium]